MAVFRELRRALGSLVSHPMVLLLAVALTVLRPPPALRFLYSPIYLLLAGLTFFVTPVVLVALLTRADDALRGREPSGLVAAAKDRYVPLLVGNLGFAGIRLGVNLAAGLFAALVVVVLVVVGVGVEGLVGGGSAAGTGTATGESGPAAALAGVTLVGYLVAVLVGVVAVVVNVLVDFCLVFYKPAVVVGDRDVGESFRESYRLVRENLGTAAGFYVVRLLIGLLFGGVALGAALLVFSVGDLSRLTETASGGLLVVLGVVAVAYLGRSLTYAVTLPYTVNVYQFLRYRSES